MNEIASEQATPTESTKKKAQQLMDYVATDPDTYIRFHASDIILNIDSDAAYLVAPKAQSRVAGYFQLGSLPISTHHPKLNGSVLVKCKTLWHDISSAAEAETGGIFHNAQVAIPISTLLHKLNHPQSSTSHSNKNRQFHSM